MTREQNVRSIIETHFAGFKEEIIDSAVNRILELKDEPKQRTNDCDDVISREDVLMTLTEEWTEPTDEIIHRLIKRIQSLSSVNQYTK